MSHKVILTLSIIFALLWGLYYGSFHEVHQQYMIAHLRSSELNSGWGKLIDISFNSFFDWRFGFVAGSLSDFINNSTSYSNFAVFVQLIIFLLSFCLLLCFEINKKDTFNNIIVVTSQGILLLLLFGFNPVLFGAVTYLPILILVFCRFLQSANYLVWLPLLILISYMQQESANDLALLIAIAGIIFSNQLTKAHFASAENNKRLILGSVIIISISCLPLLLESSLDRIEYPLLAKVIPDDGLAGIISPLIGKGADIAYTNRGAIKVVYTPVLLVTGLYLLLVAPFCKDEKLKRYTIFAFIILALNIIPSEEFAHISPLSTLSRILPNTFLIPLEPFVLLLIIFLTSVNLLKSQRHGLFAVLLLPIYFIDHIGYVTNKKALTFAAHLENEIFKIKDQKLSYKLNAITFSPSLYVLKSYGDHYLFDAEKIKSLEAIEIKNFSPEFEASKNSSSESFNNLIDGRSNTRWSTMGGGQKGDEWLKIKFSSALKLRGIELRTGQFIADFPASIVATSCDKPKEKLLFPTSILDNPTPPWLGKVFYTEEGYPYFGSQAQVYMVFEKEEELSCILIKQLGENPKYDWSVSEINILR